MAKLWHKGFNIDKLIEEFTVGDDYVIDRNLVISDCIGSIAHGEMLQSINILTQEESQKLKNELVSIIKDFSMGKFKVEQSDEDCHTAIENRLVEKTGQAGKKIHTGRSRNDQVLTALRIYSKAFIFHLLKLALGLGSELNTFAKKNEFVPMPGRTHTQTAMPSSVGLWAGAFGEEMTDNIKLLLKAAELNDQCPLGSAASYGVPLPLDRKMSSDALGFSKVQNNVLYANNSRGKIESIIVDCLEQISLTLSKISQDLIMFSLPEFGYFSLPKELCTGSSIMPQKNNPDGLELIRAKSASLSSYSSGIKSIIRSLPSGYNRDFQETKNLYMKSLFTCEKMMMVMTLTIQKLTVNADNLKKAFTNEIYATDQALSMISQGKSFRDAYRETGENLASVKKMDPDSIIQNRKHIGSTGNLGLEICADELKEIENQIQEQNITFDNAIKKLIGFNPEIIKNPWL